jgi:adenylate cyclase
MFAKNRLDFIVPAVIVAVFVLLGATGATNRFEQRIYDIFLRVKPEVPENPSILLLDVEDLAISKVGVWPWSRDIMADGLVLMREFGAAYAVFDITYVNKSPRGVDTFTLQRTVPDAFDQEFSQIRTNIDALFEAIRTGSIPLKDARRYVSDLDGLTAQGKEKLLETVRGVERDNDEYLGQAARFFGSTFLTVSAPDQMGTEAPDAKLIQYAMDNLSLKNLAVRFDPVRKAATLEPSILPIMQGARGAGFPDVYVDDDGVRRRVDLVKSYQGKYFAQLALRPLLQWLGDPEVVLQRGGILLKGAQVPGKGRRDISIPLASDGMFLINWSHKQYTDSFRHRSFYELVYHGQLENDLVFNLSLMNQGGYLAYDKGETNLLDAYSFCQQLKKEMLAGGDLSRMDDYVKARLGFFDSVGTFLGGDAEKRILSDVEKTLAGEGLSAADRKNAEEVRDQVSKTFEATRGIYGNLVKTRQILSQDLPGSFCIIGNAATSTTDIGVNPFQGQYVNVGTHASVVNTILQGQFLNQLPWWCGAVLALILSFAVTLAILPLDALRSILVGGGTVVVLIGLFLGLFLLTGIYIDTLSPVASVFLTFLVLTALKFLRTEREKSFVRSTFAHYLSSEVIDDLLQNPEKVTLGGQEKNLTAMFTDVRGFSTISEVLSAPELVHLLNLYLSAMSEIILDLKGTIDKYEGDAIMSFFGAPVDLADHARRACLAAVQMKRTEISLNERFLAVKLSPTTLHSRIGINTGDMVVGNMGTPKKMDYTIMGNAVNLASRLETVNKQYDTWTMMSEITREACGDGFFVRKLDRVRVVGINKPVRLYELIEEKGKVEKSVEEAVGIFHQGLEAFETREWKKAEKLFGQVLALLPEDGPAKRFAKRCEENKVKPPADSWDGVFILPTK